MRLRVADGNRRMESIQYETVATEESCGNHFEMSRRLRFFCSKEVIDTDLASLSQTLAVDLLNPTAENQLRSHKLKRLVQNPNSFFMDVKCPGCFAITTVFSHAQTVVVCSSCAQVLCQPTGGKGRLTEGELIARPNVDECVIDFDPTSSRLLVSKKDISLRLGHFIYVYDSLSDIFPIIHTHSYTMISFHTLLI